MIVITMTALSSLPTSLRARNKQEKLQRIVLAATQLFRAQGFHGTTGRQICAQAEIGTGTLFLYVKDKRELLFLIFRPRAQSAFDRLARGLGHEEGVVDGLMRLFGALFRLYGRDVKLARLFVQELLFRPDPTPGMAALSEELRVRVGEMIVDARDRRELRSDVELATLGASLTAHYVLWLQIWIGTGATTRKRAEASLREALRLQLDGVGASGRGGV